MPSALRSLQDSDDVSTGAKLGIRVERRDNFPPAVTESVQDLDEIGLIELAAGEARRVYLDGLVLPFHIFLRFLSRSSRVRGPDTFWRVPWTPLFASFSLVYKQIDGHPNNSCNRCLYK